MKNKYLTLGILLIVLMSNASAENGIIDSIMDIVKGILGYVQNIMGSFTGEGKEKDIICNPPYMRYGEACCLDENENWICDTDDTTTTTEALGTTVKTTTTSTTTTTTTSSTTTTTQAQIACYLNRDCGEEKELRVCYKGDVYLQRITPTCRNAGTANAKCVETQRFVGASLYSEPTPYERCGESCVDGRCV